jgi:hypothetical protein
VSGVRAFCAARAKRRAGFEMNVQGAGDAADQLHEPMLTGQHAGVDRFGAL